ncbi:MAG: choline/ethanolamine kinase family protein [Erysipelotrichaceae bacterium]
MKLEHILDDIFKNAPYQIEESGKGLTNHNLLCTCLGKQYMIRIPHEDSEHIVDRDHEAKALSLIKNKGLDVEELYFNQDNGIRITKYHSDLQEYETCNDPNKIEKVAHLMRKLHDLKGSIGESFDPIKRFEQYSSHIKQPIYDCTPFKVVIEQVRNMKHHEILCHNDWVSGNILFGKNQTYLIDYEYAADNDPLFDVMSFFSENQIVDETLRHRFYKIYFKNETIPYQALAIWENFQNLLWCTWAMMMYESRHEIVYKEIATWKYEALLKK